MKHRKMVIVLLIVTIFTEVTGAILNRIVVSANGGMPSIAYAGASGKWVPFNQGTQLALLSDVIQVGAYALSIGDLFIITGIVLSIVTIWITIPKGRKFFPLLIASIIGIFLSIAEPNNSTSTLLFEIAAICSILAIYWEYRITIKTKAMDANSTSNDTTIQVS